MNPVGGDLVAAAAAAVTQHYRADGHFVGAALRGATGRVYTGVNLQAYVARVSVCAEVIALGQAVLADDLPVSQVAAVFHPGGDHAVRVCSPCGMCRELLSDYSPGAQVLVPGEGGWHDFVGLDELLPNRYSREPPD